VLGAVVVERPVLRIGDRVMFEGIEHHVVALSGNSVRLLSAANEPSVVLAPYLQAASDFAILGTGDGGRPLQVPPLGLLQTLPEPVLQAARERERHLVEVETGLPLGAAEGTRPRPQYDPVLRSLAQREQAKAEELRAAGARRVPGLSGGCVLAIASRGCGGWSIPAMRGGPSRPGTWIHES
jgi:hypothetical protein